MPFTNAISPGRTPFAKNGWLIGFIIVFLLTWLNSFLFTSDMANWRLENVLTIAAMVFMVVTYRKFKFSDLSYLLIAIFLCLHVYGSKHAYAENPFGYWLMEVLETPRNHYDRIVHFSFGFLLAYPMREVCLKWLGFPKWVAWALPIEITLSLGAFYEIIEWVVADVFFNAQGDAFLGTQGDIWDAQKDIALAVLGAIIATTIVSILKRVFKIYEQPGSHI